MIRYQLRENQKESVEIGLKELTNPKGCKSVLCLPVAYGKSLCISEIVRRLPEDGNILCMSPNEELLVQGISKIESFGTVPNAYSASINRKEFGRVVYATNGSVSEDFLRQANIKYVLWDEADYSSKGGSVLAEKLKKAGIKNILGLSGTPVYLESGQDGSVVKIMTRTKGKLFNNIAQVVQMKEMTELGYWTPLKFITEKIEQSDLKLNSTGVEYTEDSVAEFSIKNDIIDKIKNKLEIIGNESVLIFVNGVNNVEEIARETNSVYVHSKLNKKLRKEYVEGFLSGKYKRMVNDSILQVGFDLTSLQNIIDANPTASIRNYIQRIGRLVRLHKGKEFGRVFDISGNYQRFGDLTEITYEYIKGYGWGLFSGDKLLTDVPAGSKEITTKEYLLKHGKPKSTQFEFTEEHNGSDKLLNGKFQGKSLKQLYFRNRWYLKYLYESGYTSANKKIEETLKLMFG